MISDTHNINTSKTLSKINLTINKIGHLSNV